MKDDARLELKLSKELLEAIKEAAAKKQLTVSAFVRLIMLDYLKEQTNGTVETNITKL